MRNTIKQAIRATLARRVPREDGAPAAAVCPPASDTGSIGDEAMIDALLGELRSRGARVSFIERNDRRDWTQAFEADEPIAEPTNSLGGWRTFGRALAPFGAVFVIGADVIDGKYSPHSSTRALRIADFAARAGRSATVTGASFNASPHPDVVAAVRSLHPSVRLLARDARSAERLQKIAPRQTQLVADLAFLVRPDDSRIATSLAWLERQRAAGRRAMGVNLGPTALKELEGATPDDAVAAMADSLAPVLRGDESLAIAAVPHDTRGETSDLTLCRSVVDRIRDEFGDRVFLFDEDFQPSSIKAFASRLHACVTSRMHLAIACLGSGTPVGAITYQDKFEGLFDHFGLAPPAIAGSESASKDKLRTLLDQTLSGASTQRDTITKRLDGVKRLAAANLPEGLFGRPGATDRAAAS